MHVRRRHGWLFRMPPPAVWCSGPLAGARHWTCMGILARCCWHWLASECLVLSFLDDKTCKISLCSSHLSMIKTCKSQSQNLRNVGFFCEKLSWKRSCGEHWWSSSVVTNLWRAQSLLKWLARCLQSNVRCFEESLCDITNRLFPERFTG